MQTAICGFCSIKGALNGEVSVGTPPSSRKTCTDEFNHIHWSPHMISFFLQSVPAL